MDSDPMIWFMRREELLQNSSVSLEQQAWAVFANTTRERCMYTAMVRASGEQWFEPPEPALDRYLLRSRPRAANDNRRLSLGAFRTMQIGACMALISAVSLISALVR